MIMILILGAHGQIARVATDLFLNETDAELTLYWSCPGLVDSQQLATATCAW